MIRKTVNRLPVALLAVFLASAQTDAQSPLGVRASGMGGAFVAVADDATAVYWNPAGLATGSFASLVLEVGEADSAPGRGHPAADHRSIRLIAGSLPPIGLSYYRLGTYTATPQGTAVPGMQGREGEWISVRGLTTSHLGLTLLQSLTDHVVVGTTVKLVRGEAAVQSARGMNVGRALDLAATISGPAETTGDIDAGIMITVERFRFGLSARNLTTPEFPLDEGLAVELARQVRLGAAWAPGWPGASKLVLSLDADVTRQPTPSGDRRDVAAGVETWWLARRLGVRTGMRGSTVGGARPVVTGGVSVGVWRGVFVEAHAARGDAGERSWSAGARVAF